MASIYDFIRSFPDYEDYSDEEIRTNDEFLLYSPHTIFRSIPYDINELKNVIHFSLTGSSIHFLPETIGQLTNLKHLKLTNNRLTKLPENIGDLVNLEHLDLHSCRLTSLPRSFVNLTSLKKLYLNDNRFLEFPKEILELKKLEILRFGDNPIIAVPEEIENLENLETLLIRGCRLYEDSYDTLKNLVMTNSKITRLETNNWYFEEEINRNKRGESAPGRITVKGVE